MARILMVYGTTEGQTRKIVETIGDLAAAGHEVETADAEAVRADWFLTDPDAVLLAASVHIGKHPPSVGRFVMDHRARLEAIPSAFLSVSLAASGDAAACDEAGGYVATFLSETGWKPAMTGIVAGALPYSRYGFLKRLMMKQIAKRKGLPTDTSCDHEFTDWNEVRRFAAEFFRIVEAKEGIAGAPETARTS